MARRVMVTVCSCQFLLHCQLPPNIWQPATTVHSNQAARKTMPLPEQTSTYGTDVETLKPRRIQPTRCNTTTYICTPITNDFGERSHCTAMHWYKLFSIYVPNMRYLVCVACAPSCYITWTFFPNSSYKRQLKIDWRCRCVSPFSSFKYVFVHSYSECCKNTKSMCPVSSCGPPPPSLTSRNGAKLWKHKHPLLSLCFALIK